MKALISSFKRYKPVHWIYNLFHYKNLLHNKEAFQKYNIHKPLFTSISSKDFPDKKSTAWLDVADSRELAPQQTGFQKFSGDIQEQILQWSENGFILLKNFFDNTVVDAVNNEIERIIEAKLIKFTHDNKLPFANRISPVIKAVTYNEQLISILHFLLRKEVIPFQTLNFIKGSNQRAHSDSIHMTTYPLGFLIAAWVLVPVGSPLVPVGSPFHSLVCWQGTPPCA